MATFIENFRNSGLQFRPQQPTFERQDPVRQQAWQNADTPRMEEDVKSGKIQTPESQKAEYDTVITMDNIYSDLSDRFQNYFYDKYRDSLAEDDVPDEVIQKESSDFLKKEIKDKKLNDYGFANGKTFIENFRKYGYEENLLPDPDKISTDPRNARRLGEQPYRSASGNWITGRRLNNIFPFKITTPTIQNTTTQAPQRMV